MLVFDEEIEEVGEVYEGTELVHVVLEVLLPVGLPPVFEGLGSEAQDFVDALKG